MNTKYVIKKTKKEANKALTASTREEMIAVDGKSPIKVKVVTLTSLQSCFGWQKKSCERIKPILEKLGYTPLSKGIVKFVTVLVGRKIIDFVFANKA